jgi:hypothetical protein
LTPPNLCIGITCTTFVTPFLPDKDIPITPPLSPAPIDDEDVAAKKSNEIRIGPITRARDMGTKEEVKPNFRTPPR